jgi:hypothetical protein
MKPEQMSMSQFVVFRNLFVFSKLSVMESWIPASQSANQPISQSANQLVS